MVLLAAAQVIHRASCSLHHDVVVLAVLFSASVC